MSAQTNNLVVVKRILDRWLPSGDIRPLLDGLADDVELTVTAHGGGGDPHQGTGKAAVLEYFASLGDLVTFWRVKHSWSGAWVVVLGEEHFTVDPGGLEAHSEFAMIFELRDGLITRLLIVEDRPVLADVPSAAAG